tara:strand:+ start:1226 stop:1534 length:309 start_codon:yes stop_codon:yes gene_type:complete
MAITLKPKRSETNGTIPTGAELEVGELAMNPTNKKLFTKDSSGNIITVANYSVGDPNQIFPIGDYGNLSDSSLDAFGISINAQFDCQNPTNDLTVEDLGDLS